MAMATIRENLESASSVLNNFKSLERLLKLDGTTVKTSPVLNVQYHNRKFQMSADRDNISMVMEGFSDFPVDIDDMLQRTQTLLSENADVRVYFSANQDGVDRGGNIYEFMQKPTLLDKKLGSVIGELTLNDKSKERYAYVHYIPARDSQDKPRISLSPEIYKQELVDLLTRDSRAVRFPSDTGLYFDFYQPLQSVRDFVALADDIVKVVGAERFSFSGLSIQVPIKELNFERQPPVLEISAQNPFEVHYICKIPRRYGQEEVHQLESLQFKIPYAQISKVAEFLEGLRLNQKIKAISGFR